MGQLPKVTLPGCVNLLTTHNYYEIANNKIKSESNVNIKPEIKDDFGATIRVKWCIRLFC